MCAASSTLGSGWLFQEDIPNPVDMKLRARCSYPPSRAICVSRFGVLATGKHNGELMSSTKVHGMRSLPIPEHFAHMDLTHVGSRFRQHSNKFADV
jgi:hypothetical protein